MCFRTTFVTNAHFEGLFGKMFPLFKNGHFKNVQNRKPFLLFEKNLLLKITP